jgi:imidazolonepropionase-like amidohydrolase
VQDSRLDLVGDDHLRQMRAIVDTPETFSLPSFCCGVNQCYRCKPRATGLIPIILSLAIVLTAVAVMAQKTSDFSPEVREFITIDAPVVALTHVRVIDGTGSEPKEDQTLVISHGKISAVGPAVVTRIPIGATVLNRPGYTVIPGLVGMHDHMHYLIGLGGRPVDWSYGRLYLANGVTTIRTTGSVAPYLDLYFKKQVDRGEAIGPKINVTSPHLVGSDGTPPEIHLRNLEEARRVVDFWADEGVGSFKIYRTITRAELKAAIDEAHKRHLTITGHLCSVTFREAAEMDIDDLEHGFIVATDFVPNKRPDVCPVTGLWFQPEDYYQKEFLALTPQTPAFQDLVHTLIAHHVAITSTLPTFEGEMVGRPVLDPREWDLLLPDIRNFDMFFEQSAPDYENGRHRAALKKEMELERAFAAAGGTLMNGPDPPGGDFNLPGFGDLRGVELLVEAGFTPQEAIKISTSNGAEFLGYHDRGTLAAAKDADLVLIHGNPSRNISDIRKIETVFKDGVGYDPAQLIESVRGQVGLR